MLHPNLSLPARLQDPLEGDGGTGAVPPATPPVSSTNGAPAPVDANLQAEIDNLKAELNSQRSAQQDSITTKEQVFTNLKARFVASGLSEDDAEVYAIATLTSSADAPPTTNGKGTARPSAGEDSGGDKGPSRVELELANTRAELTELRRLVGQTQTKSMQGDFTQIISQTLDSNPELSAIMKRAGADNADELRKILVEDLSERTKSGLRKRRDATRGGWEDKWMAEEAKKAAAELHKRYRTVIADPSLLGPSETVAEADRLLAQKPIPVAEYKPGMTLGDAQQANRSYVSDQVARMIAETTKVKENVV